MKTRLAPAAILVVFASILGGCTLWQDGLVGTNPPGTYSIGPHVGAKNSSPWQTALGLRANFLVAAPEAAAVYVLGSVQRQWFDGGHDNVFSVGIQGRRVVSDAGTWLGAEGTYNNWRVSDGGEDPVGNAFGVGLVGGHPIGGGRVDLWASAGILQFGDFEADGMTIYDSGTGYQFNVGVEIREFLSGR